VLIASSNPNPSFLYISDIHLDSDAQSISCSSHQCTDTDQKHWAYTKEKISSFVSKKDSYNLQFMVYTGDLPSHGGGLSYRKTNIGVVLEYLSTLADTSGIPLLFVPGNNDGLADDYASFRNNQDQPPFAADNVHSTEWPFVLNKGNCGKSGNLCYIDSSQVYGYYSAYPLDNSNLRFIGLNTVIYNNRHSSPCYNPPADGEYQTEAGQKMMKWFSQQMVDAGNAGEQVLIAMHIPPGIDGYGGNETWPKFGTEKGRTIQNEFIHLVGKYKNNVIGILTGHTHMDEIRMIYDSSGIFSDVCISTLGITPVHMNNPGFKLFTYDSMNYELMNFTTFWSDFFTNQTEEPFNNSYSFDAVYASSGQSIRDRLAYLDKHEAYKIEEGINHTYKVGKEYHLSYHEKKSMRIYYDGSAVPVDTLHCPDFD
jgi:hypothetical protein